MRTADGRLVTADGHLLPLRLDLRRHSPTGFRWGYFGAGEAQLALALLADATGDDQLAVALYLRYSADIISTLDPDEDWMLTQYGILRWVRYAQGFPSHRSPDRA
jgi:hypothetical protein